VQFLNLVSWRGRDKIKFQLNNIAVGGCGGCCGDNSSSNIFFFNGSTAVYWALASYSVP
jgi:hypothetical protein